MYNTLSIAACHAKTVRFTYLGCVHVSKSSSLLGSQNPRSLHMCILRSSLCTAHKHNHHMHKHLTYMHLKLHNHHSCQSALAPSRRDDKDKIGGTILTTFKRKPGFAPPLSHYQFLHEGLRCTGVSTSFLSFSHFCLHQSFSRMGSGWR